MKNVKIFSSIEKITQYIGGLIISAVNNKSTDEKLSLVLSGGSTPKKIYEYLAENYSDLINWEKIKFFFGDERCVPPSDEQSNFKMVNDALFKKINIPGKNIFRIFGENDPKYEAERYGNLIKEHTTSHNEIPQFDIVLLGLGEDGHTASLFPNQKEIFNSNNICEPAVYPTTKQNRITLTGRVIINAKLILFIVTGEKKSNIVAKVLNTKRKLADYPASQIYPKNGNIIWLLDKGSAKLLNAE